MEAELIANRRIGSSGYMCTSAPQILNPRNPETSSHTYPLPPRPILVSCQPQFFLAPVFLHLARALQNPCCHFHFPYRFPPCHIHSHGLSSSHIHTEHVKSPLPDHRPFTTSCQVLQSSRRSPRLPLVSP
jgi:hypothetical protein